MEVSSSSSIQSLLQEWANIQNVQTQNTENVSEEGPQRGKRGGRAGGPPPPPPPPSGDSFEKSSTGDDSVYSNGYGDRFSITQNSGPQISEDGVEGSQRAKRPGGGPPPPPPPSSTDEDDDYDYYEEFTTNYWNNVEENAESKAALDAFFQLLGSTIS